MSFKTRMSPHLPTSDVLKMVDFYLALGFSLLGDVYVKEGIPCFAQLVLGDDLLRIELWGFPDWEGFKAGFSITTLWIETDSVDVIAAKLQALGIPFHGPTVEDYGSKDLEVFDPEGFRIIFAEEVRNSV